MDNMRSQFYHDAMTGVIKPGQAVVIGTTGYFRETRFHPVTDDWEYGGYFQETKVLHPDDYGRAFGRVTTVGLHIKVMMISLKNISKKNHPIFFSTNT